MINDGASNLECMETTGFAPGTIGQYRAVIRPKANSMYGVAFQVITMLQTTEKNYSQIAEEMGVSRQRIHQIVKGAKNAGIQGIDKRGRRRV